MWGYPRCTMFSHCWGVSRRLITLWCRDWPRASLYSESGPAVHFFLWVTVHTPLIPRRLGSPVQAGNNSLLSHLPWKYEQTFTRGCERDMKQASHIAAAECESVFVSIKVFEIDHVILCTSPCTPRASRCRHLPKGHGGTSCSPAAPQPTQPKLSHRHLLYYRTPFKTSIYSLLCGPDTTSSPISRGEPEKSESRPGRGYMCQSKEKEMTETKTNLPTGLSWVKILQWRSFPQR